MDGRSYLKTVIGADKLLGTTDTLTITQKVGPLNTSSDPTLFGSTVATTSITVGSTNEAGRITATTIQKHGKGNAFDNTSLSGVATIARPAAITVGDLATTTNYLNVYGQMTTGTTEYGQIHAFTMEIMG